jgi:hypothetical protein
MLGVEADLHGEDLGPFDVGRGDDLRFVVFARAVVELEPGLDPPPARLGVQITQLGGDQSPQGIGHLVEQFELHGASLAPPNGAGIGHGSLGECHRGGPEEEPVEAAVALRGCLTAPVQEPDWIAITRRNARSVQTTVGWIFWDPGAVARYDALGLPGPLGYIGARAAPLAPAGPEAVEAAFGSISALGIALTFDAVDRNGTSFDDLWHARDEAVVEGLRAHAPDIVEPLVELGPPLWAVVEQLPTVGRPLYASHLRMARPTDPLLSGWHAVNCIREWRGDTHWAIVVASGLSGIEASILHNAWLGYERDWLPGSRGSTREEIEHGWASLRAKGLADDDAVTAEGVALRQHIEDETDRLTTLVWELLGEARSLAFATDLEPPCELLLARVDETAGPNYQPASRLR